MVDRKLQRRVVCFDLGGVLVDICRTWAEACARCNLPVKNAEWLGSEQVRARRRLVVDKYQRGELESGRYYVSLADALDNLYTPSEVERIHRAWPKGEVPGVGVVIEELSRDREVRTACLSNTNAVHWAMLQDTRSYPALQHLDVRFASHLLGCTKPDPRVYSMVQVQLEAHPEDILFFDDQEINVVAARDAGWRGVWVDPAKGVAEQIRSGLSA